MTLDIRLRITAAALLLAIAPSAASAKIVPACLFTDNAVLQQKQADPVWGTADPNEPITVSIAGQSVKTTAGGDGKWTVQIGPLNAGGPYTLTIAGTPDDTLTLKNVLVGEVWICGGQSNMSFPLIEAANHDEALAKCADPLLHFAKVANTVALSPQSTVQAAWSETTPETARGLTAVGYFFGRQLRKALNVPVGLINDNWGGTPAQAWMSRAALEANPDFKHHLDEEVAYPDQYNKLLERYQAAQARFVEAKTKYTADAAAATAAGAPAPTPPVAPRAPIPYDKNPYGAMHLYNGMLAPVIPYGIKGAIWYQGESNAGLAYEYKTLFPAMITDWRKNWGEGDFPFLFVQLAPFQAISSTAVDHSDWAELRESQRLTLTALPNTGMAVITDEGAIGTIHPKRKEPVGVRLSLIALAQTYGKSIEYSGPVLDSATVEGSKIRVNFTHANRMHAIQIVDALDDGALIASADKLVGFEIAGADKKYYAASALIDGSSVVVSSASVAAPVAVRYGWAKYPVANLSNGAGLPASPFTTDNWDWSTKPIVKH